MRHIAMATITLPVMASFEDDGIHTLAVQAAEALKVEAISEFCLLWDNDHQLENMQISPVGE